MTFVWTEYGKADSRWLQFDAEIFAIEIVAGTVMNMLAAWNLYLAYIDSPKRYFYQIVLASIEIFGTYSTFAAEIFRGSPNLHYSHPLYFLYYLVFTNGIWVWVPLLLLYHAYCNITRPPVVIVRKTVIKQD